MFGLTGLRLYGVLGAALAALLLIGWALRLDGLRASYKAERDAATVKLETTAASVDRITAELNRVRQEQQSLAAGDAARKRESKEALARAEASAKARQTQIDRLRASAAATSDDAPCEPSEAVKEIWR